MVLGRAESVDATSIGLRAGISALRLDAHLISLAVPVDETRVLLGLDAHVVLALEVAGAVRVGVALLLAAAKLVIVGVTIVTRGTSTLSLVIDSAAPRVLSTYIRDFADLLALLSSSGSGETSLRGRAICIAVALVNLDADSPTTLTIAWAGVEAVGGALGDTFVVHAGLILQTIANA